MRPYHGCRIYLYVYGSIYIIYVEIKLSMLVHYFSQDIEYKVWTLILYTLLGYIYACDNLVGRLAIYMCAFAFKRKLLICTCVGGAF